MFCPNYEMIQGLLLFKQDPKSWKEFKHQLGASMHSALSLDSPSYSVVPEKFVLEKKKAVPGDVSNKLQKQYSNENPEVLR